MITLDDACRRATITVPEAGELLGISTWAAYRAVHAKQIPSLQVGRSLLVPTGQLLAMLGRATDVGTGATGAV